MAGRRRGARSGRGWDAAPPRAGAPGAGRVRGGRGSTGRDHGFAAGEGADPEVDGFDWPEGAEAVRSGAGGDAPGRWTRRGGGRDRSDDEVSGVVRGGSAPDRDESELAREICLRQLAVRPRTRAELAGAMARRGISEKVAEEVLDRYDEVGIIDDAAFARAWVSSRHHGRGLARRALANELRQRGVDGDVAGAALGELDEETETETARALVERKLRTARGEPDAVFRRLVGMLARKGYPAGVAVRAVKDALAAQSAEAAEFTEQIDADALVDAEIEAGRDSGPVR